MTSDSLLRHAELWGVAPGYHDVAGEWHALSPETARALLSAMGADPDGPMLPPGGDRLSAPVIVAGEGGPVAPVALRPSAARLEADLDWALEDRDGARLGGGFIRLSDLPVDPADHERRMLDVGTVPGAGYFTLRLRLQGDAEERVTIIAAPERCFLPELGASGRSWGVAVQLYSLRSPRSWGIGDFTDLVALAEALAPLGADAIGVNPLHALFLDDPDRASPYAPSTRLFHNPLYLDVEAVPEFADSDEAQAYAADPALQAELARLRDTALVDYRGVAAAKRPLFERLYRAFRSRHLDGGAMSERGEAFRAFQARRGEELERFGRFEALAERFGAEGIYPYDWRSWPVPYRHPATEAVAAFAAEARARVEYHHYLQFLASEQLGAAAQTCRDLGMAVGLYHDLAVGFDGSGAESWAEQGRVALAAKIGAPPDPWAPGGQDWGLPPYDPHVLRESGFAPFIATLRAAMDYGGGVRIDHVLGLYRLFWIPQGGPATEGAYVMSPFEEMLAVLRLESRRDHCLVVGEDLGTVPPEIRAPLREGAVLSYRLIYFERDDDGAVPPPGDFPELACVSAGTHDLPTLVGYWQGSDITTRAALGLLPDPETEAANRAERDRDRAVLWAALVREGITRGQVSEAPDATLAAAIYRYLARTPAKLLIVPIEDLIGAPDQVNLPGTTDAYPNWRRKLPEDISGIARHPFAIAIAEAIQAERPRTG